METSQKWYINADADIGRISTAGDVPDRPTITCPEMTFNGRVHDQPTMREEDCKRRLANNLSCRKCAAVNHLRAELNMPPIVPKTPLEGIWGTCPCGLPSMRKATAVRGTCCRKCRLVERHRELIQSGIRTAPAMAASVMRIIEDNAAAGHGPSRVYRAALDAGEE